MYNIMFFIKTIMEFPSNFDKQVAGGEISVITASQKLNSGYFLPRTKRVLIVINIEVPTKLRHNFPMKKWFREKPGKASKTTAFPHIKILI